MTTTIQPARDRLPAEFDRSYWLSHCEGYRVETEGGRLGFVQDIGHQ